MFYVNRMATFVCLYLVALSACSNKKPEISGTVIILNGPSAIGKSSTIKAFQAKQTKPWLGMGIDNLFVGVLPSKFLQKDNPHRHVMMHGVATEDAYGKLFTLYFGPEGRKIIKGMHRAIAAYARAGNNVIVDYIMYEQSWHADLMQALDGISVIYVGLTASLTTIEQREKKRATSPEGHARSLYESVHQGWNYDLKINTDDKTPDQVADLIVQHIGRNKAVNDQIEQK